MMIYLPNSNNHRCLCSVDWLTVHNIDRSVSTIDEMWSNAGPGTAPYIWTVYSQPTVRQSIWPTVHAAHYTIYPMKYVHVLLNILLWFYHQLFVNISNLYPRVRRGFVTGTYQITKFMRPTWGPPGSCRSQMGPMLAPWTLLSGLVSQGMGIFTGTQCKWSHQWQWCNHEGCE